MGLISKHVNSRANQQLAAPVSISTYLSASGLRALIEELLRDHNGQLAAANDAKLADASGMFSKARAETRKANEKLNRYYIGRDPDGKTIFISYQKPVSEAAKGVAYQGRKLAQIVRQGYEDGHWLAAVKVFGPPSDNPDGPNRVQIQLRSWVTDKDNGKMANKDKYQNLVGLLHEAITQHDVRQPRLLP